MCSYTDYRTKKQPILLDVPASVSTKKTTVAEKPATPVVKPSNNKKPARTKTRTVEDVEHDIEKAEAQVKTVETALSEAALQANAEQLTQLSTEYEHAKERVDELLIEWERLAGDVGA
ncbi:MAG: hypothetical protein NVSMB49_20460 [Ktedonobacteraceae bacterium]